MWYLYEGMVWFSRVSSSIWTLFRFIFPPLSFQLQSAWIFQNLGFRLCPISICKIFYGEAATDNNFISGSDKVTYQINTRGYSGPFTVSAELLYHPVSYQFAQGLLEGGSTTIESFTGLYQEADKAPVQIAAISQTTGTTTTSPPPLTTTEPAEAPMILHDVSGREGLCLICHGEQGAEDIRFPEDPIGRTADECLNCHEAAMDGVTTTTPPPTTTTAATITWGN